MLLDTGAFNSIVKPSVLALFPFLKQSLNKPSIETLKTLGSNTIAVQGTLDLPIEFKNIHFREPVVVEFPFLVADIACYDFIGGVDFLEFIQAKLDIVSQSISIFNNLLFPLFSVSTVDRLPPDVALLAPTPLPPTTPWIEKPSLTTLVIEKPSLTTPEIDKPTSVNSRHKESRPITHVKPCPPTPKINFFSNTETDEILKGQPTETKVLKHNKGTSEPTAILDLKKDVDPSLVKTYGIETPKKSKRRVKTRSSTVMFLLNPFFALCIFLICVQSPVSTLALGKDFDSVRIQPSDDYRFSSIKQYSETLPNVTFRMTNSLYFCEVKKLSFTGYERFFRSTPEECRNVYTSTRNGRLLRFSKRIRGLNLNLNCIDLNESIPEKTNGVAISVYLNLQYL